MTNPALQKSGVFCCHLYTQPATSGAAVLSLFELSSDCENYNSTCIPISMTRSGGILKYTDGLMLFFAMNA